MIIDRGARRLFAVPDLPRRRDGGRRSLSYAADVERRIIAAGLPRPGGGFPRLPGFEGRAETQSTGSTAPRRAGAGGQIARSPGQ